MPDDQVLFAELGARSKQKQNRAQNFDAISDHWALHEKRRPRMACAKPLRGLSHNVEFTRSAHAAV
jgi:hypothetical protein